MAKNLDPKTIYEMMENMLTGVAFFEVQKDNQFECLYMNNGAFRMLGYTPEAGRRYVKNMLSLILDEDKPKFWQGMEDVLKDDGAIDLEVRTVTASGNLRWLQVRANLYQKSAEKAIILCAFLDATDRKFVEDETRIQSEWYQLLLEEEGEWIFDYNAKTDVMVAKQAGQYGLEVKKIVDHYLRKMKDGLDAMPENERFYEILEEELKGPRTDLAEVQMSFFKCREKHWYRIHTSSIAGVDGYVTHIVGKITDIHERKQLAEELREQHKLDSLTGWYNAEETKKQVEHVLSISGEGDVHAFILVDISDFRVIYDTLGEETGNTVVKEVAGKVARGFKRLDILGRIGTDELVLFVQNIRSAANVDAIAARVSRNAEMTFGQGVHAVTVAGSVGVSVYPYQGGEWAELYMRAEKAVNTLKAGGKKGYHIYDLSGIYTKEMQENEKLRYHDEEIEYADQNAALEDIFMQLGSGHKLNENKLRAMIKLTLRKYGFHKAYLSLEEDENGSGLEFRYSVPGYETPEDDGQIKWVDLLRQMGMLEAACVIHNYDPIPEELSSYMIRSRISTLFLQPVFLQGHVGGVYMMGECSGREWKLRRQEEKEFHRILQLLQMFVLRYKREQRGLDPLGELRVMDDFDSYVLAVDHDTYELCYANRKLLEALPDMQIGDYCYHTFAHRDRPCGMCIMQKLGRNDIHARCAEERFSTPLRSWMKMHASWLQNDENSATCLMNLIDISEYFMGGN